ncbi:MAG: hypothetical protein IJF07_01255 [Lachnospiraceae bacterium]|nr:hypothetical protein [Lachnospiraceae bacterium]
MIGYIKGYDISMVSKRRANRADFGLELSSIVPQEELKKAVLTALCAGGKVYSLRKKKKLVACVIFTKEQMDSTEITQPQISLTKENILGFLTKGTLIDNSFENTKVQLQGKEIKIYRLVQQYILPEYQEVEQELEQVILLDMKELMIWSDIQAVFWKENILVSKQIHAGALGAFSGISFGISMGITFGIIFDNVALGICFGVLWATTMGMAFTPIYAKDSQKKSDS